MNAVPKYDPLEFGSATLQLRSYRQQILASNLVNADTPNYKARDISFAQALQEQLQGTTKAARLGLKGSDVRHYRTHPEAEFSPDLYYRTPIQPSLDGNTVDPDVERSHFSENAFFTESTLTFLNSTLRTRLAAITGQPSA